MSNFSLSNPKLSNILYLDIPNLQFSFARLCKHGQKRPIGSIPTWWVDVSAKVLCTLKTNECRLVAKWCMLHVIFLFLKSLKSQLDIPILHFSFVWLCKYGQNGPLQLDVSQHDGLMWVQKYHAHRKQMNAKVLCTYNVKAIKATLWWVFSFFFILENLLSN